MLNLYMATSELLPQKRLKDSWDKVSAITSFGVLCAIKRGVAYNYMLINGIVYSYYISGIVLDSGKSHSSCFNGAYRPVLYFRTTDINVSQQALTHKMKVCHELRKLVTETGFRKGQALKGEESSSLGKVGVRVFA